MNRSLAALILGGVLAAQMLVAGAKSEQSANPQPALTSETASVTLPALPAAPRGNSTILGGEIQNLDTVRDQFRLKTFGQKPIRILFDERTQAYLDGKRIQLRDLRSANNASVQTVLDGTNVFAISIHLLSRAPEGECQGQVLEYNSATNELTVNEASSREPVKLLVPMNTPITRVGQGALSSAAAGSSDLVKGTLISLTFESDRKGRGIVSRIAILATAGSEFVFSGSLASLDMHSGLLVLVDPRDEKSYEIFFDSSKFPTSQSLHEGDNLRVTTTFDGARYVAGAIAAY
jgi:hypothetical protein